MTLTMHIATMQDAMTLADDVRPIDAKEWRVAAGPGLSIRKLIQMSTLRSTSWAIRNEDDKCLCLFGCGPTGTSWLIGTNEGQRLARQIQKHWREGLRLMHHTHETLEAHAYDENTLHHYWMERLGFVKQGPSSLFRKPGFTLFTRHRDTPLDVLRPH